LFEFTRTTLRLSQLERGLVMMYLGFVATALQGFMASLIKTFRDSEQAMWVCFLGTALFTTLVPLFPAFVPFVVVTTLQQVSGAVLGPASSSVLSRYTPSSEQGSLMGVTESLVNLGGIVGPLIAGYVLPVSHYLPFVISSVGLLLSCRMFFAQGKPQ